MQWLDLVKNLFKTIHKLDKIKNSEPKFSKVMFPMMKFLKINFNFKTGEFTEEGSGFAKKDQSVMSQNLENQFS